MQHEIVAIASFQRVDDLLVFAGAKGGHHESLCFTTGEQGGTMGALEHTNFCNNGADRCRGHDHQYVFWF